MARYPRNNRARIKTQTAKALDEGVMLKALSGVRKSLIEADRQTKLAADDIEDVKYTSQVSVNSAQQYSKGLDEAIKCMKQIEDMVAKCVDLSAQAKKAIRGESVTDIETVKDDESMMEAEGARRFSRPSSYRNYRYYNRR